MTYGNHHEATVLETVEPQYIFCFSYGDINGGRVRVVSQPDFPLYKIDPKNDRAVVKALHRVISSVDVIVAHNIAFDVRMMRARFIKHRLPPLKPFKTICTLKLARQIGKFPDNTLKQLAIFCGVKRKMETSKNLWQKIYFNKDPKAWREMIRYNRVDTIAGREILKILQGWSGKPDTTRPNAVCQNPTCGSDDVQFRGPNKNGRKKYFSCNKCKKWGLIAI